MWVSKWTTKNPRFLQNTNRHTCLNSEKSISLFNWLRRIIIIQRLYKVFWQGKMYQRVVVGDHYIFYFNTNSFHNEKYIYKRRYHTHFRVIWARKEKIKMFEKRAWATNGEIGPVADQIYEIWTCKIFVIWIFTGESKLCIYTKHLLCSFWMNNRHVQLFNFLILLIIAIFAHLSLSIFLYPHLSIHKLLPYKESS